MTKILVIAAAAAAVMLAFTASPASAKPCDDDSSACPQPSPPVKLDQFMNTWKPVSVTKQKKKYSASRSSRRTAVREAKRHHQTSARAKVSAAKTKVAVAAPKVMATPTPAPEQPKAAAVEPQAETNGVAVSSFNDVNELDMQAERVQIVAFNDVNEIDLAAPPVAAPKAARETAGQSMARAPEPGDNSWIGKLLLAAAGTLALAGAARMLVAA